MQHSSIRSNLRLAAQHAVASLLILVLAACTAAPTNVEAAAPTEPTIWVMSNGWHTEIILRRQDIPSTLLPEINDYPRGKYFAFGWGDARYYPARSPTAELAIKAIATPTPAVMHMTALPTIPEKYYLEAEILRLPITSEMLATLSSYLHNGFARNAEGQSRRTGPGLYRNSDFYDATGQFHLFNTCNTWTSRGLAEAGYQVGNSRAIQAEALMAELRPIAAGERPADSPELRQYYHR